MEYEKIVPNVEDKMLNNKNEVISVLPRRNFNDGDMKKTYKQILQPFPEERIYIINEAFSNFNISDKIIFWVLRLISAK